MFLKSEVPKNYKKKKVIASKQSMVESKKKKLNQTAMNPILDLKKMKDEYMLKRQTYNISIDLSARKSDDDSNPENPAHIYYKRNEPKLSQMEPEPYPEKSPSQDITISDKAISFDSPPPIDS